VSGFIDHFYTQLETTSNYSAIANLYTFQIITAPTKPFPACCVFMSRSLATASNNGNSSASRAQVLSSQPPVRNSCLTSLLLTYSVNWQLCRPNYLQDNSSAQTTQTVSSSHSIVVESYLPCRCLTMATVLLLVSRVLPSNGVYKSQYHNTRKTNFFWNIRILTEYNDNLSAA
jgi:hypothetical protein